ncbi:hypothetical protein WJS89_05995 [Sphingomicrobium sp. XHP0235]|uniref:hypothetical protein n=1 Tax=Sphingomicrobium aquimarinum TaxID=3133971 RepID=UPI0031FE487A
MIGAWIFRRRTREPVSMRKPERTLDAAPAPVPRIVLPTKWTARDWRAMIALWASIIGAGVLTLLFVWTVRMVRRIADLAPELMARVLDAVTGFTYGLLIILGAILLSLGLAINRRSFSAKAFGASIEASGGARHADEPS